MSYRPDGKAYWSRAHVMSSMLVRRPKGNIYGITQAGVFNDVMAQVLSRYHVPASTTPSVSLAPKY